MELEINSLIKLDNNQIYCVIAELEYESINYYALAGIADKNVVTCFATCKLKNGEKFIEIIEDKALSSTLVGLLFDSMK